MNKLQIEKLKQERETLQDNLITFLGGLSNTLITNICQVVVDYYNKQILIEEQK